MSAEPSYLLNLPRELRDEICSYIRSDYWITPDKGPAKNKPSIFLDKGPQSSLMRTCRQISDEYGDVWLRDLHLRLFSMDEALTDCSLSNMAPHMTFPTCNFQHIEVCSIHIRLKHLAELVLKDVLDGTVVQTPSQGIMSRVATTQTTLTSTHRYD